jgi:hypothetical protein
MQDLLINTLTQEKMLSKKYLTHFKNEEHLLELKTAIEDNNYFEAYQLIDPESDYVNDIIYNYSAVNDQIEVLISEDLILDCIVNKLMTYGYDDLLGILNTIVDPNKEISEKYTGMVRIIRKGDKILTDRVGFETSLDDAGVIDDANIEYEKLYKLFVDFANKLYQNAEKIKQRLISQA